MQSPLVAAALNGVRVIDLTDESCVYATKMLADLGAQVIRIEPPGGDALRKLPPFDRHTGESMFHAFMNVNKLSVTLDLESGEGRDLFRRLVGTAAIVVESCPPGVLEAADIGYSAFAQAQPQLVWTSITAFGQDGPRAGWTMDDLVAQAMGGLLTLTGLPDRPPLRLFGEQTCYIAGLHGAAGTLIAYWHALASGDGQHVDVSIQDCVAHTLENAIQYYTAEGTVRARQRDRADPGAGIFPCADGQIFLMAGLSMISSAWHNLVDLMVAEGIEGAAALKDERWLDREWRKTPEAQRTARAIITSFTSSRGKNQLYDLLQQKRVLCAPFNQVGDLFDNAQLKFLDWFREQELNGRPAVWPGPPVRLSETPRRAPVRVPGPGCDTDAVLGPLADDASPIAQMEKEGI